MGCTTDETSEQNGMHEVTFVEASTSFITSVNESERKMTEDLTESITFYDNETSVVSEGAEEELIRPKKKRIRKKVDRKDDQIWTIDKLFSQTTVVDLSNKTKKVPKPKYYDSRSRHFRILRKDIRKDYTAMVANILNSSDFHLIRNFFVAFGAPNGTELKFGHDPFGFYDPRYRSNGDFNARFTGIDLISCVMGAFSAFAPDYTFQIQNAQILIRGDAPGSMISSTYTVRATYITDFRIGDIVTDIFRSLSVFSSSAYDGNNPNHNHNHEKSISSSHLDRQDTCGDTTIFNTCGEIPSAHFDEFVQKIHSEFQQKRAISRVPFMFTIQGNCSLQLDERQCIERISFTRLCCTTTWNLPSTC